MSALSPETRRLLELSRRADDLPASRERQVRDRLAARLGAAALMGAAAGSAAGSAGAATTAVLSGAGASSAAVGSAGGGVGSVGATTSAMIVKTILGFTLAASIGASSLTHDTTVDLTGDAPHAIDEIPRVAIRTPLPRPDEPADRDPPPPEPAATASLVDESIESDPSRHEVLIAIARRPGRPIARESELVLIERAERALAARDYRRAGEYIDRHEAKYSTGPLRDAREALRVLADCARGATERARAGAASFAHTFADSNQLPRVRACSCSASEPLQTDEAPAGPAQTSNF